MSALWNAGFTPLSTLAFIVGLRRCAEARRGSVRQAVVVQVARSSAVSTAGRAAFASRIAQQRRHGSVVTSQIVVVQNIDEAQCRRGRGHRQSFVGSASTVAARSAAHAEFRRDVINIRTAEYCFSFFFGRGALYTERKRPLVIEHSLQPSVGLCVSVQCIVAKRLIGYGCGLRWYRSDGSRDEAGSWVWRSIEREGVILGANMGR